LQPGELKWLSGEEQIRTFKVPEAKRFTNNFCATCGSRLPRHAKDTDAVVIPAGSLDDVPAIKPQARIFYGSRASWSCGGDALPAHTESVPQ
jgi:hypothetical protein